ncbi:MAG TPA: hypothetical protein VMI94_14290 [Bryobacteraceae bacterium]|nr:hypothetical protein [Bryobacteraceae bacterium]
MRFLPAVLLFSIALLPGSSSAKSSAEFPVIYSGGSLPFHHNKVHAMLSGDEVILMQHSQRITIPAKSITEISCGAANRYVGVSWSGSEVLLELSRSEYRAFLAALEQMTGIKPTDTSLVPTVVRYRS